jgi:hypothetical protein
MPLGTYSEPKFLDQLLGAVEAQCNSTVSAGTAAQTSLTLRGSIGSGNADVTPSSGEIWLFVTPGSAGTQNQYTNWDVFQATGGTATSITFASRTVVAARAVGDYAFRLGTTTSFLRFLPHNTVYIGLSTVGAQTTIAAGSDGAALPQSTINVASTTGFAASGTAIIASTLGLQVVAYTGVSGGTQLTGCTGGTGTLKTSNTCFQAPTSATILSNEPTSTGSYARVAYLNNPANWPAASAGPGSSKSNGNAITFPASTAAWSSGATALDLFFIADAPTLAGGNVLGYGYLTNSQTVNASGITPSFASSQLTATLL